MEDSCEIYITVTNSSYVGKVLYVSTDKINWTKITTSSAQQTIATLNTGDKLYLYGFDTSYGYNTFNFSKNCYVYGNIMSLFYGQEFVGQTTVTGDHACTQLFKDNAHLLSHPSKQLVLPIVNFILNDSWKRTYKAAFIYKYMFQNCTALVRAPEIYLSHANSEECYGMFKGCTSLEVFPYAFNCGTLGGSPYKYMFDGCTSLKYIKMMTDDPCSYRFTVDYMTRNVPSVGVFICNKLADPDGTSHGKWYKSSEGDAIPSGWTVYTT